MSEILVLYDVVVTPEFLGENRAQLVRVLKSRRKPEFFPVWLVIFLSVYATRRATLCNYQRQNPRFSRPFHGFLRNTPRNNVQLRVHVVALPPLRGGSATHRNYCATIAGQKAGKTPSKKQGRFWG